MIGIQRYPPLAAVLILVLASQPVLGKIRDDWSQVRSIPPGKKIAVVLHQDTRVASLPRGKSKVKGVFSSASDTSITLQWKNGQSVMIDSESVRKVSVRIPIDRRTKGWIATAIAFGAVQIFLSYFLDFDDLTPRSFVHAHGRMTAPAAFLSLRGFGTKKVYNVPPR